MIDSVTNLASRRPEAGFLADEFDGLDDAVLGAEFADAFADGFGDLRDDAGCPVGDLGAGSASGGADGEQ